MPARTVKAIRVRVPPGPRGEVGFAIGSAGVPIYPSAAGTWVIADDEIVEWPLVGAIDSGAWQLIAYNTGTYAHTLHISYVVQVVGAVAGTAPPSLTVGDVSGVYMPSGDSGAPGGLSGPPPPSLIPPPVAVPPAMPPPPDIAPLPSPPPVVVPPPITAPSPTGGATVGYTVVPSMNPITHPSAKLAIARLAYLAALGREPESANAQAGWASQILDSATNVDAVIAEIADGSEGVAFRAAIRARVAGVQ
jgi:hypothetical protein